ncbi:MULTISPECIES: leucyl aminopeptidase [Pseudonocardia]|uniref:Probable cytosol aminopeptidase n=2 Tax=Pseudonocardia TaxID=1847 RepID=A0A1Y2MSE0_PSEAH|nr:MULTISPECIES: leucyl aminopeptidase [Pseudonocardia]OSY37438.1 Cytosol aminopeptidase [Pseudonocardia autotrophica]TDN77237.1 leucyl aminopeptidase [Pseudonocardia autotrophica]BBG01256.1 putative cytosol aminopeptidase [Pseudonocardia autotrophica]GEC25983.1 putative cytosol aminopeptidase [Pseudonocardia saturnea]
MPTAEPTIPDTAATTASPSTVEAGALVIGLHPAASADGAETTGAPPVLAAGAADVDAAFGGELAELLRVVGATGKVEQVVSLPTRGAVSAPRLVAVGLGEAGDDAAAADRIRRAAGAAARTLAGTPGVVSTLGAAGAEAAEAAVVGALLGGYRFDAHRSSTDAGSAPVASWTFTGVADELVRRAALVAEAVATARDLVNTAPNVLVPETFAARAVALGERAGLVTEVLDDERLRDNGYGGITGVGKGSSNPPRLVRLTWNGGAAPARKVALVGKGITFDTGGISLKPNAGMADMTSDMGGAAAVVATVVLAAKLELPVAVTATVPMAENMPSSTAYKPGDVLTMYGGRTVEVLNTDAEGRLILADALVRAGEDDPDYLVETSTLTGAQQVALGLRTAGIMGSDDLRDRVAGHAVATGEDGWAMPLPEYLRSDLDSRVADLANVSGQRFAGMLLAGLFLKEFVPAGVPWAHIDVAGPAYNTGGPRGYTTKGGTGVPVRTLIAFLEDVAANG